MNDFGYDGQSDDLQDIEQRLREQRVEATPLELDQIKLRAMSQASRRGPSLGIGKGLHMRSRVVTLILAGLLVGGTTAGGVAWEGGGDHGDNAGESEYHCEHHENHGQEKRADCQQNDGDEDDGGHGQGDGDGGNEHGGNGGDHGHGGDHGEHGHGD